MMTVDHLQETSPYPLWKGIVATVGGFALGLPISEAMRLLLNDSANTNIGLIPVFVGTLTGYHWLMEHWRWKESRHNVDYRPASFVRQMVITVVLAVLTAVMSHLNDAL